VKTSRRRVVAALSHITCSLPVVLGVTACVHQAGHESAAPAVAAPPAAASPPQPSLTPPTAPAGNGPTEAQAPPSQPPAAANARTPGTAPKAPASVPRPTSSPRSAPLASAPPPVASAPALDLKALEQRLRDTSAIGVFTKLTLKNQVDDLLAQFKAFHEGHSQATLAQLRQKYEELLLKVVSLLQDGDPALASAISASREAIWNVLTDPKKFANI